MSTTALAPFSVQDLIEIDAALRSAASATLMLERLCRARGVSGRMRIERLGGDRPAPPIVLAQLAPGTVPLHRHVRLLCGDIAVSDADNWYDPAALTASMRAELDRSDTPFGLIVAPLGVTRRTLSSELRDAGAACLEHWAALHAGAAERAFAVVAERYGATVVRGF